MTNLVKYHGRTQRSSFEMDRGEFKGSVAPALKSVLNESLGRHSPRGYGNKLRPPAIPPGGGSGMPTGDGHRHENIDVHV